MSGKAEGIAEWQGPALFSYGFRPFFLAGALWAAVSMLLWVGMLTGLVEIPTVLDPVSWHAHEFLFGYLSAAVAGFFLTAIPNWTGRPPVVGIGLAALISLWVIGRLAVLTSAHWSPVIVALVDLAMLASLFGIVVSEIIKGRTWRNLVVLLMLAVLITGNAVFHWEAAMGHYPAGGVGLRIGLSAGVMMIAIIGGRIVPAFTRNWLLTSRDGATPAPFSVFDGVALIAMFFALTCWVIAPDAILTGVGLVAAGVLHLVRLGRWNGHKTAGEPLVWVLHAGYGFVPVGAIVLGAAILSDGSFAVPVAQHVWMAGAIGLMTLAVMTRATLGHTGRDLRAGPWTARIYLMMIASVVTRLMAALLPMQSNELYLISGLCWFGAFGLFVTIYGPMLVTANRG